MVIITDIFHTIWAALGANPYLDGEKPVIEFFAYGTVMTVKCRIEF